MTEGKRIPRLQVTAQGRLVDEAIIQLVKNFEKPSYKISRSTRVSCGRDRFACTVKLQLFCLRSAGIYMIFKIIQYLISRDKYTRCHMTILAKKPKKMLEVYQTLLPARGWGLGTRLTQAEEGKERPGTYCMHMRIQFRIFSVTLSVTCTRATWLN